MKNFDYRVKTYFDDNLSEMTDYASSSLWRNSSYELTIQAEELKKLFFEEDWVYITVDLIASEFTSSIPKVFSKEVVEGKTVYNPNEQHPIQQILDDPAFTKMDQAGFYYQSVAEYGLMGNCILVYLRENSKFMLLPTERVSIDLDNQVYKVYGETGFVSFKFEDVLHIKRPNLASPMWGLSPFVPGKRAVLFNRYSQEYLNHFYLKGASPDIILETDISGSVEALRELQKSFEQVYTGRKNQRRTLVLPKGVTSKTHDARIADQNITELIKLNRDSILNILRVPKHALSLQEAGSLGSEEHRMALKYFWQATIKPIVKRFSESFTKFFKKELQNNIIDFDISEVEVFSEDLSKKAMLAQQMLATRTLNEVRKEVWEVDPIEGGDRIPGTQPTQPLLPELLQQPQPQQLQKFNFNSLANYSDAKAEHYKALDDESPKIITSMKDFAIEQLLLQVKIALDLLKPTKADFNKREFKERLSAAYEDLEEQYSKGYADVLKSTLDLGYASQLRLIFNAEARSAIEALRARTEKGTRAILEARGIDSFSEISKTTSNKISDIVADGFANNLTVTQIANNLADKFAQLTQSRANTIARTETLTAVSLGQWGAIKNASKVVPKLKKVWITADDERVRGRPGGLYEDAEFDHWALHGDMVDSNKTFSNGLLYPRDPRGEAGNVINCRCTVAMIAPEDIGNINI